MAIGNYTFTVTVNTTSLSGSTPQTIAMQSGVTYLGDLNGDGQVNFSDLVIFTTEYINWLQSGTYYPNIDYVNKGSGSSLSFTDENDFIGYYVQWGSQNG